MARIAVIGPGAIGGTLAAWLAQDPDHALAVCARSPIDRLRVETPEAMIEAEVMVWTAPDQAQPVDWVLAATKTYDSRAAAQWLPALLGGEGCLAVLQNGIEHRSHFAGTMADERIVPAIVDIPAERTAPGHVLQRRLGWIKVPDDQAGRAFASLFHRTRIEVSAVANFDEVAWRKLAVNCAGAVSALALRPAGIAQDEEVAEVMRGMVRECVSVGRAEGVPLPDSLADEVIAHYRAAAPESVNSLHADRLAGRPMEVEARNGIIVRLGRRHGIATPFNRMATALLSAAG